MKNTKKASKKQITSVRDLAYSIYVVCVPCTGKLLHWRGYKKYETARARAARIGGIVSSAQFLRRKFGPTKNRRAKKAA